MAQPTWLRRAYDALRKPAKPSDVVRVSNDIVTVSTFTANRPAPVEDFDPKRLIDEGYRRNVIVYTCVNEIAQSAAAPRFYLQSRKTQEEVEEHDLLGVFARPAPGLSWYELIERLLIHQQTAGTGYLHKGRAAGNQLVQLRTIRPERITPVPDTNGNVVYYEYKIDGVDKQRVEPEDVAPFPLPDPLNDFHGLAPLMVCGVYGDIDTAAAMYLRDFFANGAMPMGLLKFKTPAVRREDRLRVQSEWEETYGGGMSTTIDPKRPGRWHNVGVIGGDVEYQPLASEPAQLRLDSVWGQTESRICATFGVPPQIVAAKVGLQYSTYANQKEARRSFWTETLVPIYRRLADGITRNIVAEVDEELEFRFDLESIPELQEDLSARVTRATALFAGGLASLNEARELSDLEEVKTDYFWKPSTGSLVKREDVETGKVTEDAEKAKAAMQEAIAGKDEKGKGPFDKGKEKGEPPGDEDGEGEGQSAPPFELLGLGTMPEESEREIFRAMTTLDRGFSEAVREAVEGSDAVALAAALASGDWREAEAAVATDRFVKRYVTELERHLLKEGETALRMHYQHHTGEPRETHSYGKFLKVVDD